MILVAWTLHGVHRSYRLADYNSVIDLFWVVCLILHHSSSYHYKKCGCLYKDYVHNIETRVEA